MMHHFELALMRVNLLLMIEITQKFQDERIEIIETVATALLKEKRTSKEAKDLLQYIELSKSFGIMDSDELPSIQEFLKLIIEQK